MTLSSEQFNMLATKEDLKNFMSKDELDKKLGKIINILDVLVKQKKDQELENLANIKAHGRINRDLLKVKEQAKIKDMEVVEQFE